MQIINDAALCSTKGNRPLRSASLTECIWDTGAAPGAAWHEDEHLTSVVFTFSPSPGVLLLRAAGDAADNTRGKAPIFEGLGVDVLIEYPFDQNCRHAPGVTL